MAGKLGKKPATPDPRDIRFRAVAATQLPSPPARFGHGNLYRDWFMLGNGPDDTVARGFQGCGCCVFSGGDHETMLTNKLAGKQVTFFGINTIRDYSAVTGYVLGDDTTDQGTDVRTALKFRAKTGLQDAQHNRHKIGAYVSINAKDWTELRQAVYVFSAVGIGLEFPNTAMEQFDAGDPWDVVPGAKIEGGHYVPVVGASGKNTVSVITWGKRQTMTRDFYETYNDEAWAIVFPEELRNGKTERGMDLSQLQAALGSLG